MISRLRWLVLSALFVLMAFAGAQEDVVKWRGELRPADVRPGEHGQLILIATIKETYHIYSLQQPEGGLPTTFEVTGDALKVVGDPIEPKPAMKPDVVGVVRGMHEGEVAFAIPVQISDKAKGKQSVSVVASSQACDAKICLAPTFPEVKVEFEVASGEVRRDRSSLVSSVPEQPAGYVAPKDETPNRLSSGTDGGKTGNLDETQAAIEKARESGLLSYMLLAFLAGLAALITPCVFPMIPVTVSFFSKSTQEGKKVNYRDALLYCFGIVGTFTLLGLIVTLVFGSTGVQDLATNGWVNLFVFALFTFLSLNLFGLFELTLPSWMVNKANQGAMKGGIWGPLLMGLTFSLTTFTCTVPFVGTILAAAAGGDLLYPIFGMIAFSSAFAIPFFLLAIFPQFMAKMPKSGGWLSVVKAYMGFLELVAAVKFLSSADLAFNLGFITRGVFLSLWATILVIAGLYMLGWLTFPHQDGGKIGLGRRAVGVTTVIAAFFCLAGIQGRSLGLFDSFAPPDPYPGTSKGVTAHGGIKWLEDYEEAKKLAAESGKPIFVNFTGVNCSNCRWMERNMFTKENVLKKFDEFVMVELYTDRPMDKERQKLQKELTGVTLNPTYVLVTPQGEVKKIHQGLEQSEENFLKFLAQVK